MTTNETNHLSLALEPGLDRPGSSELSNIGDKRGIALLEKFDRALSKRVSTKREQAEAAFKELFPRFLAYRSHGRTMKELLVAFNTVIQGNVCNKTFKLMFDNEARRHDRTGQRTHCHSCDQLMPGCEEQLADQHAEDAHD